MVPRSAWYVCAVTIIVCLLVDGDGTGGAVVMINGGDGWALLWVGLVGVVANVREMFLLRS